MPAIAWKFCILSLKICEDELVANLFVSGRIIAWHANCQQKCDQCVCFPRKSGGGGGDDEKSWQAATSGAAGAANGEFAVINLHRAHTAGLI